MTVNGQLAAPAAAPTPAETLRARLDDPQVAAALNSLLDHADLLALMVVSIDEFFSRGEVIADSLASGLGELRGATGSVTLPDIDVKGLVGAVTTAAPALQALLGQVGRPHTIEALTRLTTAVDEAETTRTTPVGPLTVLRALRDPDTSRGLGYLLHVLKGLGRRLP